ncbi:MAG: tetratricopeptide repeat protein [Gammaproteobacteria bacterium]|nr:tetratricopeptide repeat protein [Gammaproteobacteria bacterium]
MSLVNQMLQDLEQRRTAEAGASPLSGLSASGAGVLSGASINYLWLGASLALIFAAVFVLVYLFGREPSLAAEPAMSQKAGTRNTEAQNITTRNVMPLAVAPVAEPESVSPPVVAAQREKAAPIAAAQPPTPATQARPAMATTTATTTATASAPVLAITPHSDTTAEAGAVRVTAGPDATSSANPRLSQTQSQPQPQPEAKLEAQPEPALELQAELQPELQSELQPEPMNKTLRPLTREQQARQTFQQAVLLLGRGDESGAEQALHKTLAVEPAHLRARETLSALLLNTGRVSEAADGLREGLRLQPTATALAKLYARVLVDQGDSEAAVAVLEQAPPTQAADADYYALLAALYRAAGRHAQASQVYQQLLKGRPGVAAWWLGLALSEDAMGALPQALEAYRRAHRAGGLKPEVLAYVQSRIAALDARVAETAPPAANDSDGFGD